MVVIMNHFSRVFSTHIAQCEVHTLKGIRYIGPTFKGKETHVFMSRTIDVRCLDA